ncbi:hypothetical protein BD833_10321 [Blastococcus xanthinilyticus]|uniref:Uncharacterized protein n=1 Tax=Blastococcus xanthinilyticus TaxID=1564164 RepID=A0A5S5D182_9ACTN|nr:hypothetical protein BD833_10321 [Blastococcus xanthinilyticus]
MHLGLDGRRAAAAVARPGGGTSWTTAVTVHRAGVAGTGPRPDRLEGNDA